MPNNIFSNQPALETISLALNSIQRVRDRAFTGLNNLLKLNLSMNSLREINIFAYDHENLQILDFSGNEIEFVKAHTFPNLKNLRILNLSNNSIQRLDKDSLKGMFSLRILLLNDNDCIRLPVNLFSNMPQIEEIILNGNRLLNFSGDVFGENDVPLRILSLEKNNLSVIHPQSFLQTPNLEQLSLGFNMIKELDGNLLANVHLRILNIQHNLIEQLHTSFYNDLASVKELMIDYNRLTFLPNEQELLNLERITVEGNPWQCPCLHDIFKFITSRRIIYRVNKNKYYDGAKPICIVTPKDTCDRDIELVRQYRVVEIYERM